MTTQYNLSANAGQMSEAVALMSNTKVTATNGYIQWANASLVDALNNNVTWQNWPLGAVSGNAITLNPMIIRLVGTSNGATAVVDQGNKSSVTFGAIPPNYFWLVGNTMFGIGMVGSASISYDENLNVVAILNGDGSVADVLIARKNKTKLLLLGDSLEARSGNTFSALGGWFATITSIVNNGDGTLNVGFSSAHNIPAGQPVRISSDAISIDTGLLNRWLNFISTGSATGVLSVPVDAVDYTILQQVFNATPNWTGSAEVSIDKIRGASGSWSKTLFDLNQPMDDLVNLCVPGAASGEVKITDSLSIAKNIDLSQFSHVSICVGMNEMAAGGLAATTLANIIAISELCLLNGCVVNIDELHPQSSMNAAKQTFISTLNRGISAYSMSRRNVYVTAKYALINDPSTNTGSAIDLIDGTHYSGTGTFKIGDLRAKIRGMFKKLISPVATYLNGNYVNNPCFTGVGGTVTGPSTGIAADNWTVPAPGTNVTCTARKQRRRAKIWRPGTAYTGGDVVIPTIKTGYYYVCTTAGTSGSSAPTWGTIDWGITSDNTATWTAFPEPLESDNNNGDWQFIQGAVAGTVTAQERITVQQTVTLAAVGLNAGDIVRAKIRVKAFDSNWRNFMLALRTGATVGSLFSFAADNAKNAFLDTSAQPSSSCEGILQTDWYKIPAGQTSLTFLFEAGVGTGATNSIMRFMVTDAVLEKQ